MSRPEDSADAFPTVPPRKPPGRWLRFSLRSLLLTITLVCLVASNLYTSWQLQRARDELRLLRQEVGRLTIDDPSRVHVVALKELEDLTWRWRVYVPEERKFEVAVALNGRIPREGFPNWQLRPQLRAGEYVLTVAVRKGERGEWNLRVQDSSGFVGTTIAEERMQWLVGPSVSAGGSTAGTTKTESADPGKPLVLKRMRTMQHIGGGGAESQDKPTDGLMIWIDECNPND